MYFSHFHKWKKGRQNHMMLWFSLLGRSGETQGCFIFLPEVMAQTELVLGHGAAMWMCLFGEGEATLCPVRSHCLEQLLQFPALTAQLACKNAPSPLATAPASCSVEPG